MSCGGGWAAQGLLDFYGLFHREGIGHVLGGRTRNYAKRGRRVPVEQLDLPAQCRGAVARDGQHLRAEVNSGQAQPGRIVRQIQPSPDSYLEDIICGRRHRSALLRWSPTHPGEVGFDYVDTLLGATPDML